MAVRGLTLLHRSCLPLGNGHSAAVHHLLATTAAIRLVETRLRLRHQTSGLCCCRRIASCCSAASAVPSVPQGRGAMATDVQQLVQQIHDSPTQAVLYATGGGFQALSWLLTVPGASRTLLDARVPYATGALTDLLGSEPATYASPDTARAMAAAAYRAAADLAPFGTGIVGLGCSCALATDRPKRGEHKVVVAAHSGSCTGHWAVSLEKGARDRVAEDAVASRLLLRALAHAAGVPAAADFDIGLHYGGDGELQMVEDEMAEPLRALLEGRVRSVEYSGGLVVVDAPRRRRMYLPGSFNPLHDGHRQLLAAACRAAGGLEGSYELTVGNADKGTLPLQEVQRRLQPFLDTGTPIVVTQAPLFSDKAALFRDCTFAVGYDTAMRLVDPKYYGGNDGMVLAMAELHFSGCRLLVAGRAVSGGEGESPKFLTLADVAMSKALQKLALFQDIPETEFRLDISSTELRRRAAEAAAAAAKD